MSGITVKTEYMEHTGGSKFYEAVLIEGGGQAMCIKRYGTMAQKKGGGQKIVDRGGVSQMTSAFTTIISQKQKRGYSHAVGLKEYGLHDISDHTVQLDSLTAHADLHYGKSSDEAKAIRDFFVSPLISPEPTREPEVEVDRGEAWGMF